jgi:2-C-methyl-D-erythritol 4-phosphate cytidylyltransferase
MKENEETSFTVVFLAGGKGLRMGTDVPKQYLSLQNKPLALHSFEVFIEMPEVEKIVVVCEEPYKSLFLDYAGRKDIFFVSPGFRRQDSVMNGIEVLGDPQSLVCIHDAARPCIQEDLIRQVVAAAREWGAAALGVPVKATIKLCDATQIALQTLEREHLWEIQTPQVVRLSLLRDGFAYAKNLTVTDDVSLVELLGRPVKIVRGSYTNIKVTTLDDLLLVKQILEKDVFIQTDNRL